MRTPFDYRPAFRPCSLPTARCGQLEPMWTNSMRDGFDEARGTQSAVRMVEYE
jgi:hypothetical protein